MATATQQQTSTVTPEDLDRLYPAPPWANRVIGSIIDPRPGWGRDCDGSFIRITEWERDLVVLSLYETCDRDGHNHAVTNARLILPDDTTLGHLHQGSGPIPIIQQLITELRDADAIMPTINHYTLDATAKATT